LCLVPGRAMIARMDERVRQDIRGITTAPVLPPVAIEDSAHPVKTGWWLRLALALCATLLLALAFDRTMSILWVGQADLAVEVKVVEAGSGRPVPGARVEVLPLDRGAAFALATDGAGVARADCPRCKSCGERSPLRLTDTFSVHKPAWWYRASAPGYETGQWAELGGRSERTGPGKARLTVRVELRRADSPARP